MSSTIRPEGILQNVITYLCFEANPLSSTKLTKLVYLLDVYHYQMFGERVTNVPFIHYLYGPWAPHVEQTVQELCAQGILSERVVKTTKGPPAMVPEPKVPQATILLPKTALEALKNVVDDWGNASTEKITEYTKATLPFANTSFNQRIDFSRSNPVTQFAKEQGISEEEAATEDLISDESLLKSVLEGDADAQEGRVLEHEDIFGA